jgi:NAD(P)H-dependent flavin oxidoreductase YrpB (nitropropane dioxygenase family)
LKQFSHPDFEHTYPMSVPVLKTLLNIDLPIVQAPMAGVQGSALAIAVSNTGALGSLPCAMLDLDGIRRELTGHARADAEALQRELLLSHAARQ